MSVQIDPALPAAPVAPQRPAGNFAAPLSAPASAPSPALAPQTTQVSISPQGRESLGAASAALQNQAVLLEALNSTPGTQGAALPRAPASAVAAGVAPPLPGAPPFTAPAAAAPNATAALAAWPGAAPAGTSGAAVTGGVAGAYAATASAAPSIVTAGAASLAWPASGVSAPLHMLLHTLVRQATAAVQAQRLLAAQPWPAALVALVTQGDGKAAQGQASVSMLLQTWLVHQGMVQTPQGQRPVSVTLHVPGPWLQALAPMPSAPAPTATPLQAVFAGPSQALQSGAFALVLESTGAPGGRTSALLTLEFQPLLASSALQSGVYGRDLAHLRQDPWLQITALQASGQVERDENRARNGSGALCDTVGCSYLGRAACVQPFCSALQSPGTGSVSRI